VTACGESPGGPGITLAWPWLGTVAERWADPKRRWCGSKVTRALCRFSLPCFRGAPALKALERERGAVSNSDNEQRGTPHERRSADGAERVLPSGDDEDGGRRDEQNEAIATAKQRSIIDAARSAAVDGPAPKRPQDRSPMHQIPRPNCARQPAERSAANQKNAARTALGGGCQARRIFQNSGRPVKTPVRSAR
jgi:hypothetical protein